MLLLTTAACTDRDNRTTVVDSANAASVTATTVDGKTRFEIRRGVKLLRTVIVDRDSTIAADAAPSSTKLVGEIPAVAVVVVDTYASKPGGMSYCQAGEEQFLRVIALVESQPDESWTTKIASCRNNIELASQGVEWRADSSLVRIHWLAGPGPVAGSEIRSLRIGRNGAVEVLKP